ncbi:hypothetical protein M231_07655 [Tremella mesenterica]|uniref:Uncharacterized protein n=1 Tax=Tremella mesenterica TaxID=5217 RepID=A0A4Q1BFP4_TREME|nr:hypothetical protein M231_07655 [Tremella mesenterica]
MPSAYNSSDLLLDSRGLLLDPHGKIMGYDKQLDLLYIIASGDIPSSSHPNALSTSPPILPSAKRHGPLTEALRERAAANDIYSFSTQFEPTDTDFRFSIKATIFQPPKPSTPITLNRDPWLTMMGTSVTLWHNHYSVMTSSQEKDDTPHLFNDIGWAVRDHILGPLSLSGPERTMQLANEYETLTKHGLWKAISHIFTQIVQSGSTDYHEKESTSQLTPEEISSVAETLLNQPIYLTIP